MAQLPGPLLIRSLILLMAACAAAAAQDLGTMNPKPLPPLEHPDDPKTPAKELFGRKTAPASMAARSIGYYTHGCLAGGEALPINGPTWQVMRLSRNRNWGHPELIKFLERFAKKVPSIGWHGLLVGDMAQPRGGPMITGHWSHQVGLDADIWLTPMPDRELTRQEREEMSATNIVTDDWKDVRPGNLVGEIHRALQDWPRRTRRSSACSPIRRSRRRCAATSKATAPGCTRSARCSGTTIISTCASAVRRTAPSARRSRFRRPTKAAARTSTGGSRRGWRSRSRASLAKPILMSALPAACKQILMAQ